MTEYISPLIRWLHLSDFHIGMDDYAQRKLFKQIHQHVEQRLNEYFTPDLIFITGDVADKGKPEQYITFVSEFLDRLKELFEADIQERIFIVPGNHDVFRERNKHFDQKEICLNKSRFFYPTEDGRNERSQFLPRFAAYHANTSIIPCDWLAKEDGCYTRKLEIKGINVGIVGINTAWISKDNQDRHYLSPGIDIIDDALEKLNGSNIKIVLGHHPVDWFIDAHVPPIRAILGKHHALYLHGHLHKGAQARPEDGAGYGFLCVQCGAAFQTEETDIWDNGLLWGELDSQKRMLRLQPQEWNSDTNEWRPGNNLPGSKKVTGTEWWEFPLPGPTLTGEVIPEPSIYPVGWQPVDMAFLNSQREPLQKERALRFFDGAFPDWRIALSPDIQRFALVGQVLNQLIGHIPNYKPQLVLLKGPIGEGKSTALMQIIDGALQKINGLKVLWLVDASSGLKPEEILRLPQTGAPWLLASDAADMIADELYHTCHLLRQYQRGDICFLLACRDSDWKESKAHKLDWITNTDFQQHHVTGLSKDDARAIIASWKNFGDEAMGGLCRLDQETAVEHLFEAATREAETNRGALIGALLKVRYGDDLKEHVKALLNRLEGRPIPGGAADLLLAFTYISAMHAEGFNFLSRSVLAEALGCHPGEINAFVLAPLGMEAAISKDGQFILTRHREIARAVTSLSQEVFEVDVEGIYIDLVKSAERLRANGEYVPNLNGYYFSIADHFFRNRKDLALRIGEVLIERNPDYLPLRTHLSRLYREAYSSGRATTLFRNLGGTIRDRPVLMEWGMSEHTAGRHAFGVILMALSIADIRGIVPPVKDNAMKSFSSLSHAFGLLFEKYLDTIFNRGRGATARMGLTLRLNEKERDRLIGHLRQSGEEEGEEIVLDDELSLFQEALMHAWNICGEDVGRLRKYVEAPGIMNFTGLRLLIANALKVRKEKVSDS
ncbi:MAG: metallophosphoesterase [Desulfobaccales bacterium]